MVDKRGLHEKADAESKGFSSPGTDEFRKQINESLKLYSESLDKLIGSLKLLERILGEFVKNPMLSEAYERFLQDSLAAEKNHPFHPGSIQGSGDADSKEDEEHDAQEEKTKQERVQEEALSADTGVRIFMEIPQAESENGHQTEDAAEQEMEESMEEAISGRRGR